MRSTATHVSRRQVLRMGVGALATVLLASCGSREEDQYQSITPTPSIPVSGSYRGTSEARGGMLHLGVMQGKWSNQMMRQLTNAQLVAVDPRTGILHTDLAEGVELPDALTVVFSLRDDLRFHPDAHGFASALTAEDVRREFQSRSESGEYLFTDVVERVETPDHRTVVLHLRGPFNQLFESLSRAETGAVRSTQRSSVTQEQLGSGPFVVTAADSTASILAPNPLYHRHGLPLLDGVALLISDSEDDLMQAFARGDLDVHSPTSAATYGREGQVALRSGAIELERPDFSMMGIGLSLLPDKGGRPVRYVPAFQDPRVRHAVSVSLDRKEIGRQFDAIISGPVGPAHGVDSLSYDELSSHHLNKHDPSRARALLEAAGQLDLSFTLRASSQMRLRELGRTVEAQLKEGGFVPRLQLLETDDWHSSLESGDFEAAVFEMDGLSTPDFGLRLHTSAGVDRTFSLWGYSNPIYDAAVRDVLSSIDPMVRADRSREAQRKLLQDIPAMFPLGVPVRRARVDTRVRGYEYGAYEFNNDWLSAQWSLIDGED